MPASAGASPRSSAACSASSASGIKSCASRTCRKSPPRPSINGKWPSAKRTAVLSSVTVLEKQQRVEEIARMLGGVKITDTTRKHAAEMLGIKA